MDFVHDAAESGRKFRALSVVDPYTREHLITNSTGPIYKFDGKMRDTESGLDDFGARYYSSTIGRFVSADWSAVPAPVPYAFR